jgi:predicted site-specific integrase-resolvase
MPCPVTQTPSGSIFVNELPPVDSKPRVTRVVVYARVSSHDRKDCLVGQADRCVVFSNQRGLSVDKIYKEIASGMNDKRPKLMELLESKPTYIVVENKDRLTRFGFNYIEVLLKQQGCEILVLNKDGSDETDLIKDMISIVTSFCCRLYGLRRGRTKAKTLKEHIKSECNTNK